MFGNLGGRGSISGGGARMLVGVPDYDTYVQHMKDNHPDKPVMTYKNFPRAPASATAATAKAACAAVNPQSQGSV